MRKLVMSLSVLGGLLFAGTLPATANAAAGLTATHINQSEGLVQKAGWRRGGWGHRGWGGGWGHRGWGGGWGWRHRGWGGGWGWRHRGWGWGHRGWGGICIGLPLYWGYPVRYYGYYGPYYGGRYYYRGYGWRHRYWGHRRWGWGHRRWGWRTSSSGVGDIGVGVWGTIVVRSLSSRFTSLKPIT